MGDIRAILGTSVGKLDQIECMANTTQVAPHVPATDHIEAIFNAVRTIYPVSAATLAGFAHPWRGDGSVTPEAWLHEATEKWVGVAGEMPGEAGNGFCNGNVKR